MATRRNFVGSLVATGGLFLLTANTSPTRSNLAISPGEQSAKNGNAVFDLGVASGDPTPNSIILWTRALPSTNSDPTESVDLILQVSYSSGFETVVLEERCVASAEFDHTVRVLVNNLVPGRTYYYRFVTAGGAISRLGRTKTAPENNAISEVKVGVMSCQDYNFGYFTAYGHLIHADRKKIDPDVDFIIHVGDFIYEDMYHYFHDYSNEFYRRPTADRLVDRDGSSRFLSGFADGKTLPETLDDYRLLYKTYLTDRYLQDCRALYPFVYIWDDHEVINDYWQSYSGGVGATPEQQRKVRGNRAWYEYMPANFLLAEADQADTDIQRRFSELDGTIENVAPTNFDDSFFSNETNNVKAVESLKIYRKLRWGQDIEFFLIDGRSYRSPRAIPDVLRDFEGYGWGYPKTSIPKDLAYTLSLGRQANGGNPPATVQYEGKELANPNVALPPCTMLGSEQKAWLKAALLETQAKWKVLIPNSPVMPFGFDTRPFGGTKDGIRWTDGWDGIPNEREEIIEFIAENRITNVVSLTGDRHAHLCGTVDREGPKGRRTPAIVEFAGAAVSSYDRFVSEYSIHSEEMQKVVGIPLKDMPADAKRPRVGIDVWMLYGAEAAAGYTAGVGADAIRTAADVSVNRHMKYADNAAYGYFTTSFTSDSCATTFYSVELPREEVENEEVTTIREVKFSVHATEDFGTQAIKLTGLVGDVDPFQIKA